MLQLKWFRAAQLGVLQNQPPSLPAAARLWVLQPPRGEHSAPLGTGLTGSICWVVLGITNCIIQNSKTTKGDQLAARFTKGPRQGPRAPQSPIGENSV